MEPTHELEASEPVSPEELRALIERFGERQSAPSSQPTVRDVAETLQVEPATVSAILRQLREAKSQQEIKERLDRLERENAELRARSDEGFGFDGMGFHHGDRRRRMLMAFSAMFFAFAFVAFRSGAARGISIIVPILLVAFFVFFLVSRKSSLRNRR